MTIDLDLTPSATDAAAASSPDAATAAPRERRHAVAGLYNLRDTGGYRAAGGTSRWGKLLRSDALHRIDATGRDRLAEIRDDHTDAKVQDYLPSFAGFCRLPIVRDFWDDPEFGVSPSRKKEDIDKWRERFEEILEVAGEYKIDVRLAALKTILAATTDRSEAELDALDIDVLADPAYGDDFFLRPSSWVHCSFCGHFSTLAKVLRHRQELHAEHGLIMPAGLPREKIKDVRKRISRLKGDRKALIAELATIAQAPLEDSDA